MFAQLQNIKCEEVDFNCPVHGMTKAYSVYMFGDTKIKCIKCDEEEISLDDFEVKRQKEYELQKLKDMNIEAEYINKELEDYQAKTSSQKKALESVQKLINGDVSKVILLGQNGVGKTMLGSIAVKKLGGAIYTMYEIATRIRQSYTHNARETELDIVKELATIPFLVIDELGRTKGSDVELNWLSYILDKRHTRKLPFMILSNTHPKSMCEKKGCPKCFENYLDSDILSRLREHSAVVIVEGDDFRANKK